MTQTLRRFAALLILTLVPAIANAQDEKPQPDLIDFGTANPK
jgi:hypothetical protein